MIDPSQQVDVATEAWMSLKANLPLVAALAGIGWWAFPKMFKSTLNNGGGDIIRAIVRAENDRQSAAHEEKFSSIVREAIQVHEQVEQTKLSMALSQFRNEITDRYDLKPRRRSR